MCRNIPHFSVEGCGEKAMPFPTFPSCYRWFCGRYPAIEQPWPCCHLFGARPLLCADARRPRHEAWAQRFGAQDPWPIAARRPLSVGHAPTTQHASSHYLVREDCLATSAAPTVRQRQHQDHQPVVAVRHWLDE